MKTKIQPPYKGPQGHYYTKQLFQEESWKVPKDMKVIDPIFCLYGRKEGFVAFGRHYVESEDPTGYTTAMELLGDYNHWKYMIKKAPWFREAKRIWDEEMEVRIQSKAIAQIREHALGDDAKALSASKFLHQLASATKSKSLRGRPTKEEVEGNLKKDTEEEKLLREDAERIGLSLIKG